MVQRKQLFKNYLGILFVALVWPSVGFGGPVQASIFSSLNARCVSSEILFFCNFACFLTLVDINTSTFLQIQGSYLWISQFFLSLICCWVIFYNLTCFLRPTDINTSTFLVDLRKLLVDFQVFSFLHSLLVIFCFCFPSILWKACVAVFYFDLRDFNQHFNFIYFLIFLECWHSYFYQYCCTAYTCLPFMPMFCVNTCSCLLYFPRFFSCFPRLPIRLLHVLLAMIVCF